SPPAGGPELPGSVPLSDAAPPAGARPPIGSVGQPVPSGGVLRSLRNWRVRSRLMALIAIPTVAAVVLGGSSIVASWQSAVAYQRVAQLASLSSKLTAVAYQLEAERDYTVSYIAGGSTSGRAAVLAGHPSAGQSALNLVKLQYTETDAKVAQVRADLAVLRSGYSSAVILAAHSVSLELGSLNSLRSAALRTNLPPLTVINDYSNIINALFGLDDQVALSSSNSQLASTARAFGQIARVENEYSIQRAIVMYALTAGHYAPGMETLLTGSVLRYDADYSEFRNFATIQQQNEFSSAMSGSLQGTFNSDRQIVIAYGQTHSSFAGAPIVAQDWFGAASETISQIHLFEQELVQSALARATLLRRNAIISAVVVGSAVVLLLLLSLLLTVMVGRSLVRPLRRLRAGALEVAGVRLPETVRRMSESSGESTPIDVDPIDVDSSDEIGEVARAFDQVHREALRLASNEAALRGNVNAMFVNLSRRSQSLVERQIRLIDELEQGEQEPERLGSLFQLDHLATRMRRNSENLLVLAGHDSSRRWSQPVSLVDVLRAAISEIEQYERVTLNVQPGISVRGPVVNDVVHLIAELVENATSFSSSDTPVAVSGHVLSSGGVLLDITDQGVGMGSDEMAHANWRLDNPPVVDVAVSRRMGLFVVARLAARHGIRVRLRPADEAGLTALVWLPDDVIVGDEPVRRPGAGSVFSESGPGPTIEPAMAGSGDWTADYAAASAAGPGSYGALAENQNGRGTLGPHRVPGAGLHPGHFGMAGTGSVPAIDAGDDGGVGGRQPGFADGQAGTSADAIPVFDPSQTPAWRRQPWRDDPPTIEQSAARQELQYPAIEPTAGQSQPSVPGSGVPGSSLPRRPVPGRAGPASAWDGEIGSAGTPGPARPSLFDPAGFTSPARFGARGESAGAGFAPTSAVPGQSDAGQSDAGQSDAGQSGAPGSASHAIVGAPVDGFRAFGGTFGARPVASSGGDVIVPPAVSLGETNRLPIFEAVESDWFRRGRPSLESSAGAGKGDQAQSRGGQAPVQGPGAGSESGWSSPGDEGWRVAAAAVVPASAGTTGAGLPRRVPRANLIPGSAAEPTTAAPARSAAATRDRFASLQRGVRQARAKSSGERQSGADDGAGEE
ncbi:MAG: nitrate- and nitrite sensing domain-containing protein, partial [Streptosporangiaceae bacterium]